MAQAVCPQVSVVMPAHNAGRWLAEAVESVFAQTLPAFELLVIDDGSTDGSVESLEALARRDGRLKVLSGSHRGLVAALNVGLAAARAPLFARLDADDVAHPRRLEQQVAFLNACPDVGVVGSWAWEIDDRGRPIGRRTPETRPERLGELLRRGNPLVHSSVMARTQLLRDVGGYRTAFEAAEDYDLWLRAAELAGLANLPELLVSYRIHDANVSCRHTLRQGFSVRLARRAAAVRRQEGLDPTDGLTAPPDWHCPLAAKTFYAEDAALYRWLDRMDRRSPDDIDARGFRRDDWFETLRELSHSERRLLALALVDQMRSKNRTQARVAGDVLLRLCRERPGMVLGTAWSLRR